MTDYQIHKMGYNGWGVFDEDGILVTVKNTKEDAEKEVAKLQKEKEAA